jgi:hypothetical protein
VDLAPWHERVATFPQWLSFVLNAIVRGRKLKLFGKTAIVYLSQASAASEQPF